MNEEKKLNQCNDDELAGVTGGDQDMLQRLCTFSHDVICSENSISCEYCVNNPKNQSIS